MSFWHTFLDLLLPRHCVMCNHELCASEKYICNSCLIGIRPIDWADTCDNPILRTLWNKHDVEMAGSLFTYIPSSPLHNVFIELKYRHHPQIGCYLAATGFPIWQRKGLSNGVDFIVPVPLSWQRHLQRGYNQAEWIAKGISQVTGIPVNTHIVRRCTNNSTQTRKSKEERETHTIGIFKTSKHCPDLNGKTILIVDDIITTGATISDCIRAIRQNYPTVKIRIFSLGHTSYNL